ncbi:hypothetical protein [Erythrobacter ani]|uniref:Lipoprotein n=1 Tax=Erythrobacter ani TaxID=2827235 RepID=A0ABS6SM52_9SPHN|nr:hypothetical protein [Erythrobacter ani]MBV7266111.1 hypothetical protein [Erythrobacter ani]
MKEKGADRRGDDRRGPKSAQLCLLAVTAMLMSACGTDPDAPSPTEPAGTSDLPAPSTPKADEPEQDSGDDTAPPAGNSGLIPTQYHGVWDYEGGTCERTSDLLMEISASEILFYESIGLVTATESEGGDVVVTLDMEGEGETWTQQTRFSLVGDGNDQRLHTSDGEAPKEADKYPSKRCSN